MLQLSRGDRLAVLPPSKGTLVDKSCYDIKLDRLLMRNARHCPLSSMFAPRDRHPDHCFWPCLGGVRPVSRVLAVLAAAVSAAAVVRVVGPSSVPKMSIL